MICIEMVDFFIALQIYASICWKPLLVETDYAIARYFSYYDEFFYP
jgi:hypothetical protein